MSTTTEEQASNHLAVLYIDRNLLSNSLGLPPETMVVGAAFDPAKREVILVVESPDLPEVKEGARPPIASPRVSISFDWGLPNAASQ